MIRPILFNTEMVRAILEGRKTVTRRLITPQPSHQLELKRADMKWGHISEMRTWTPPAYAGDLLWVRETWNVNNFRENEETGASEVGFIYLASNDPDNGFQWNAVSADSYVKYMDSVSEYFDKWRPSIHMPKEAARIFLRVTDVRVERIHKSFFRYGDIVHNISAEGIGIGDQCRECIETYGNPCCIDGESECGFLDDIRDDFARLWDSTIKPAELDRYGWQQNPWVFVIKFERVDKPAVWEDYIK